jgi:cytosine/adenosine deaminase-related metal-dependent hydrolase
MARMAATASDDCSLTARWVFPVDGPPVERGVVTVRCKKIGDVEPHGSRTADIDLGNAAILPGLVNAHTHLDLSGLRGQCPPSPDFTDWLRVVIAHRRTTTAEQTQADIRAGLAECLRFGTTLVGDIASGGASWDALAEAPLRAVVFFETIGLSEDRVEPARLAATAWVTAHPDAGTCRPGLSPHAPYSVHANLFTEANELAQERKLVLATHTAESAAEDELLSRRAGPFVAFLKGLGVWNPEGLVASSVHAMRHCARSNVLVLFAHCNYLRPSTAIARASTVVYCPRTHAAFGHPPHPFRDFLARGVRVALGTDGLASNPDLDLLAEARFVAGCYPDFSGAALLRMATLSGAEALGWADTTGSLTPGKSADLVVLPLPDRDTGDPHRLLFESDSAVSAVMFRGRWRERLERALGEP